MKIVDLEEIIIQNDIDREDLVNYVLKNDIVLDDFSIATRYIDDNLILKDFNEEYSYIKEDLEADLDNYLEYFVISKEKTRAIEEKDEEVSFKILDYIGMTQKIAFIIWKEGIAYKELLQEGLFAMAEAINCFQDDNDDYRLDRYTAAIVTLGMLYYTRSECEYKTNIFKGFVAHEKQELKKMLKPKVRKGDSSDKLVRKEILQKKENELDTLEHLAEVNFDFQLAQYVLTESEIKIIDDVFGCTKPIKSIEEIAKALKTSQKNIKRMVHFIIYKIKRLQEGSVELWRQKKL